jgi:hypothetical protein
MARRLPSAILLGATLLVITGLGCGDDKVTNPKVSPYLEPTSPSNVVANLQLAYQRREIDEYAKLLAPEFIFKFQPVDAQEIAKEFWTRDEDLAGTGALFGAAVVTSIAVSLGHGPDAPADDLELPDDARKIRIDQTFLQVDETTGITWVITDLQDMFFRPGDETLGEDPDHWFLIEWRDIPTAAAASGAAAVRPATWGKLKSQYQPAAESTAIAPVTWGFLKRAFEGAPAVAPTTWGSIKSKY